MTQYKACDHHDPHTAGTKEMQTHCVSIVPIFNHLDHEELARIVQTTKSKKFKRGEMIYRAEETSAGLYIIHQGQVKIYRLAESGKEQIIRILHAGDFIGEQALFTESLHDTYAEAMEASEICMMGRKELQQFLLNFPAISLKILSEFSIRLGDTEKQAASFVADSVESRIALYLAELSEEAQSLNISLPMTRKDLASYLGTSPETISRRLADFAEAGWITQSGQRNIQILDLDALLLL